MVSTKASCGFDSKGSLTAKLNMLSGYIYEKHHIFL